jgi:hypothetical protein
VALGGVGSLLAGSTETTYVLLRCETGANLQFLSNADILVSIRGLKERGCGLRTDVPSRRFEEGTTRSRVRGSTTMPAAVLSGSRGGRDMLSFDG